MKIETSRKRIVNFSTISLTDIVLLLLIFFLLTSSFVVQPGIKVKLPKAATGAQDESDKIFLTVTRQERLYLNQTQVTRDELATQLRQLLTENPSRLVVIRADKDLSLEATIRIIDLAKLAGAERFMIATDAIL
ncbi:biopolymer transporter ExbD [candidate division KSB1 bacterium]|nr:biopolymer transporter ExbD [candidate division KSB1 bacterium]